MLDVVELDADLRTDLLEHVQLVRRQFVFHLLEGRLIVLVLVAEEAGEVVRVQHRRPEELRLKTQILLFVMVDELLINDLLIPLLQPVQLPRGLLAGLVLLHELVLVLQQLDRARQVRIGVVDDVAFLQFQILVQRELALDLILVLLSWLL